MLSRHGALLSIVYCIFLAIAIFLPLQTPVDGIDTILSITTFTFAIFLGFSTSIRATRLYSLRQLLRKTDAYFVAIYTLSKQLGPKVQAEMRAILDTALINQIDFYLPDYYRSMPTNIAVFRYISELKGKDDGQLSIINHMIEEGRGMLQNMKDISHLVRDRMLRIEWASLGLLALIIWVCLFALNTGTVLSLIVMPLVAVAIFLLLLIIYDLDNLTWQERRWIWLPLSELFLELDLVPYFVKDLFIEDRMEYKELSHLAAYRLGIFPHPYPDNRDKIIKLVKIKKPTKKVEYGA
jgi:hypothetical protein